MKKWFTALFLAIICIIYPQLTSNAADLQTGDFHYKVVNDEIEITDYTGIDENVSIPAIIDGKNVTHIGKYSFKDTAVKKVTLPSKILIIDELAFSGTLLESINIPNTVKTIGRNAFSNTNLTSIVLPEGLQVIESSAFSNTKLTSVELPNSVKEIGSGAFSKTPLTSIQLSNSLQKIGLRAFSNTKLTTIHFPASLEVIGVEAFGHSPLKDVTFDATTQPLKIEKMAFLNTKIERIVFPEGLVSIGDRAFIHSKLLKEAVFPKSLLLIDYQAFANLALEKITLQEGLQTIAKNAFANNHLRHIVIPTTVTKLGENAFGKQVVENLPPVITGPAEQTVIVGTTLHPKQDMTATDEEDGNLLDSLQVKKPSTKVPGRYEMTYRVYDSDDAMTTFTRILYVQPRAVKISAEVVSNQLKLHWNPKDDTVSYKVYLYDKHGKLLRTEKTNMTQITLKKLKAGTVYNVKVRAYVKTADKTLLSDPSNSVSKITLPAKATVTVKALSKGFKASWNKNEKAKKYQLHYSTQKDFEDVFSMTLSSKTVAKNVTHLKKGDTYYVRVRAIQSYDKQRVYGNWSTVKKVTVK